MADMKSSCSMRYPQRRTDRRCSISSCFSLSARQPCCQCSRSIAMRRSMSLMLHCQRFSTSRYLNMLSLSGSGVRISIRFLQVIRMTRRCLITGSICVSQAISPIIMLPLRLMCRLQESWDIMAIIPNRSRNISASRRLRDI